MARQREAAAPKRTPRKTEEAPTRRTRKAAEEAPVRRKKAVAEEAPTRRKKVAAEAPVKSRRAKAEKPVRAKKVAEKPVRRKKPAAEEAPVRKTRRAKAVEVDDTEDEAPARKSKRSKEGEAPEAFNPYAQFDAVLDDLEKTVGLSESAMDPSEVRLSTGLLMLDILLGGGITAGWYTNFGQEQTCKTTGAVTILSAAVNANVPVITYFDYEGSASADYLDNILRNMGVKSDAKSIFGIRDEKSGKWLVTPRVRYKSEAVAEKFFDYLSKLQRILPDKKKIGDNWYFIYEDSKENRKIVGDRYDVNYWRKTKTLRVPAPDGSLQALVLVDSYPAMLPEKQDVDDPNNAIATQARMFSDQLKRVKGKMRGKRVAVIGINQLRLKPMVAYGSPEYEPGGEALKLYCFGENTHIFTDAGMLKAKEVIGAKYTDILGLQGLETPSIYKPMGVSPVSEMQTEYGFSVTGKADHAVYSIRRGSSTLGFTKLRDISTNDYVAIKFGQNIWPKPDAVLDFKFIGVKGQGSNQRQVELDFPKTVTPELCRLAGYLVGEGHMRENRMIFSNTDREIFDDFLYCLQSVFNLTDDYMDRKQKVLTHDNGYATQFIFDCYSTHMGEFLSYLGLADKSSRCKEVPWFIRQSTKESAVQFLKALFDGEAHASKRGTSVHFASSSPMLAKQVHLLLLNIGIVGKLVPYKVDWLDREHQQHDFNKYAEITLYGADLDLYSEEIGFTSSSKSERLVLRDKDNGQDFLNRLPPVFDWKLKGLRSVEFLTSHLDLDPRSRACGRRHLRITEMKGLIADARLMAEGLRTSQERKKNYEFLNALEEFVTVTTENNLFWCKVSSVDHNLDPIPTYDFNMPGTHTVVTDGIVSHNSDVRMKWSSRALSSVGKDIQEAVKGTGQIEEEPCINTKHGVDNYRYIHVRGHKNKLSRPYLESWLRLWITNSKGEAQGFDPVFDCYMYLRSTGQVEGKRNKMLLQFAGNEAKKSINWLDFKRMILGDRNTVKAICQSAGMKPVNLRVKCFSQLASGKGLDMFNQTEIDNRGAKASKRAEDADTSDGDDDND